MLSIKSVTATPLSTAAKTSIINTIADSALASFVVIQVCLWVWHGVLGAGRGGGGNEAGGLQGAAGGQSAGPPDGWGAAGVQGTGGGTKTIADSALSSFIVVQVGTGGWGSHSR